MAAWRREAEALLAELGLADAVWTAWGELPAVLPVAAATVVSLIGLDLAPEDRCRVFASLAAAGAPGTVLVVVDHNRPRSAAAALLALIAPPWLQSWSTARRWRRLAQPTAREVQSAGFRVDRLRLAAGERVQIVVASRP